MVTKIAANVKKEQHGNILKITCLTDGETCRVQCKMFVLYIMVRLNNVWSG